MFHNNTKQEEGDFSKGEKKFLGKIRKFLCSKYFIIAVMVILISAAFIIFDLYRRGKTETPEKLDKDKLLSEAAEYMDKMESIHVDSEVDIFVKQTQGTVTKPYMAGQSVAFDVCKKDLFMIHSDGNVVFQDEGERDSRRYERYETIGDEITDAFDNKNDLIWSKKQYYSQPTIADSMGLFRLINDHHEDFDATRLFKVNGRQCYQIEGELQYADMLPYLKAIACENEADLFLGRITRNGFYAFVNVYIDCETHLPARLYIDFSEVARAFAKKDGADEGFEAQIGAFHFKMDYSEYNSIDKIDIDLSVKENAIDELMFWERLRNGDLTYEEFIFYANLFHITQSDFDFYMKKMGCSQSEIDVLRQLFNFDKNGKPRLPKLSETEFKYMRNMFRTDKGWDFYKKALGLTKEQYKYYLNFFANIKKYGTFKMFDKMTKSQYSYYKNLLKFGGYKYSNYKNTTGLLGANKNTSLGKVNKNRFDSFMKGFKAGKGYKYFKDKYKWTREEYNSYRRIYDFIKQNYNEIKKNNPDIDSWYDVYEMIVKMMKDYNKNIGDFNYSYSEFLYYTALTQNTDDYVSYKAWVDSQNYANGTLEYLKSLYTTISKHSKRFKTFQEFYDYAVKTEYQTFVQEFNLDTYMSDYDEKIGEDAEDHGGVSDGDLSDKWYSYSFKYGSKVIGLPVVYKDLANATGFKLGGTESSGKVSPGATLSRTLYNGSDTIIVLLCNNTVRSVKTTECSITSISLSDSLSKKTQGKITLPAGIKIGSSKSDVEKKYGKPYSSSGGSAVYRSNARNQNMKLTYDGGKLSKVTFIYG